MIEQRINGCTLRLVEGDITEQDVDAIVNAANRNLVLGSGVAGAIRRKGGPAIQRECDAIGGCLVGGAVITTGGSLKARHVIHAVGPHGTDPDADALLASAARASLQLADAHRLRSIALPAISTGVFGFPIERAAEILLTAAADYLQTQDTGLALVVFCLYGHAAYDVFAAASARLAGGRGSR